MCCDCALGSLSSPRFAAAPLPHSFAGLCSLYRCGRCAAEALRIFCHSPSEAPLPCHRVLLRPTDRKFFASYVPFAPLPRTLCCWCWCCWWWCRVSQSSVFGAFLSVSSCVLFSRIHPAGPLPSAMNTADASVADQAVPVVTVVTPTTPEPLARSPVAVQLLTRNDWRSAGPSAAEQLLDTCRKGTMAYDGFVSPAASPQSSAVPVFAPMLPPAVAPAHEHARQHPHPHPRAHPHQHAPGDAQRFPSPQPQGSGRPPLLVQVCETHVYPHARPRRTASTAAEQLLDSCRIGSDAYVESPLMCPSTPPMEEQA